jgi:hypothetical protein
MVYVVDTSGVVMMVEQRVYGGCKQYLTANGWWVAWKDARKRWDEVQMCASKSGGN